MTESIYSIAARRMGGTESSLEEFKGRVVLVVNVASKCGLTPQYEGLEKLYEEYRDLGFVVAGFPANDFAGQEPGTNAEIQNFCDTKFGVKFPLFERITVVGPQKHPLYQALIAARPTVENGADAPFREKLKGYGMTPNPEPEVLWNFEKFVIGRDGEVVARFSPDVAPDDARITEALDRALAK